MILARLIAPAARRLRIPQAPTPQEAQLLARSGPRSAIRRRLVLARNQLLLLPKGQKPTARVATRPPLPERHQALTVEPARAGPAPSLLARRQIAPAEPELSLVADAAKGRALPGPGPQAAVVTPRLLPGPLRPAEGHVAQHERRPAASPLREPPHSFIADGLTG